MKEDIYSQMIKAYAQMIKAYADAKSDEIIPNGGFSHAKHLIANLFSHANEVIRIFSSRLPPEIYESEEVLESAQRFLFQNQDKKIKILLDGIDTIDDIRTNRFFEICKNYQNNCEIKIASDIDKSSSSHFVVMDLVGYRFCPNKNLTAAIGCFNNQSVARNLASEFDTIFNRSKEVRCSQ